MVWQADRSSCGAIAARDTGTMLQVTGPAVALTTLAIGTDIRAATMAEIRVTRSSMAWLASTAETTATADTPTRAATVTASDTAATVVTPMDGLV